MNKNNDFEYFVGIDISKKVLDITVLKGKDKILYEQIDNTIKGLKKFLRTLIQKDIDLKTVLFCVEHTGVYGNNLKVVLKMNNCYLWVEPAIQIIRSIGMVRGKNDKIDSYRIAVYAFKNQIDRVEFQLERAAIQSLKALRGLRKRLIQSKKQLSQVFTEKEFLSKDELKNLHSNCKDSLKAIQNDINKTEKRMREIIKADQQLNRLNQVITSVDGAGFVTSVEIIITTNEFKKIKDAKKYACYSGVVPFDYSSGTSVNKRSRVSPMANKSIKTILHMAAMSAVQCEGDLQNYYLRKVAEGKNKMSVLNAIRNKLILRIFSCVNQDRLYQKNLQLN